MDESEITQSRYGTRLTYRFGADRLTYTFRDLSGEVEFSVPYETILVLEPFALTLIDKNLPRWIIGLALVTFGLGLAAAQVNAVLGEAIAAVGFALCIVRVLTPSLKLFYVKYTMLKMNPPPAGAGKLGLRIMHDTNRDTILARIQAGWKSRLRKLHLEVNTANDRQKEISKFKWLRENAVITEGEFNAAVQQIGALAPLEDEPPRPVTLN